jgi:glycosyltransferase involved in cell wall biosynthesis
MSFIDSKFKRMQKLFRPGGLERARIAMVRALPQRYLSIPVNVLPDYGRVLYEDRPACLAARTSGPLRINWLVPSIPPASGGSFNVIRTIQHLEAWGHENRIYALSLPGGSAHTKEMVRKNYFPINAEIEVLSDNIKDSDALIATGWPTAYEARRIGNTGRKFYFVQDLEYMFYARGSLDEFARNTYKLGFWGITAGSWIADVLRRDFSMNCTSFGFSYDRHAYANTGPRMLAGVKKRVLFYARPETERRGFEIGILALLLVAKKLPDVEFVLVGFPPESVQIPFPAITPGVLPLSALGSLYRSCDVALVLSHTNLSLLPLELMACGCAVVSNSGPNTEWLLTDQISRLATLDPESLAQAIIDTLENDDLRLRMIAAGLAFVQSTDWTRESKVIETALFAHQHEPAPFAPHV